MTSRYVTISVTREAREELSTATLNLMAPVGRRVTTSEVLIAALRIAGEHKQEWAQMLTEGVES